MSKTPTMAQQIAEAACTSERDRTGVGPQAVSVVFSRDTLVVSLHGALSPAEKALAKTPAGAAQVQEFHRELFGTSSEAMRKAIKRITGIDVREAVAEVETATGTVMHVFTTGTLVQVYLLAHEVEAGAWSQTCPASAGLTGQQLPDLNSLPESDPTKGSTG